MDEAGGPVALLLALLVRHGYLLLAAAGRNSAVAMQVVTSKFSAQVLFVLHSAAYRFLPRIHYKYRLTSAVAKILRGGPTYFSSRRSVGPIPSPSVAGLLAHALM